MYSGNGGRAGNKQFQARSQEEEEAASIYGNVTCGSRGGDGTARQTPPGSCARAAGRGVEGEEIPIRLPVEPSICRVRTHPFLEVPNPKVCLFHPNWIYSVDLQFTLAATRSK